MFEMFQKKYVELKDEKWADTIDMQFTDLWS